MLSNEKNGIVIARLFDGEDFYSALKAACEKHKVESGIFLFGLGMLRNFELGYFKKKGDYTPKKFKTPHELICISGNVIKQDEEFLFHIHASLANEKKNVVGGHLLKGTVHVTNELAIIKTGIKLKRKIEEIIGLKGLYL